MLERTFVLPCTLMWRALRLRLLVLVVLLLAASASASDSGASEASAPVTITVDSTAAEQGHEGHEAVTHYDNGTVVVNSTVLVEELQNSLDTVWNEEAFRSWYDQGVCMANNVSYSNRVDEPGSFNYCSVPLSAPDAFLFASFALLIASLCTGKLSPVIVLIIGGCFGLLNYYENLYRLSNAIALWLGIQPPDLFFYAFLPPLLVDAALRLDFYVFSKISFHIVFLAYGMVILNAIALTAFVLFVLGFNNRSMDWVHGAVFAAMLAPTDAVAVTAILKAGGGPELMVTLLEGEALLNDASGVTLYTVFMGILESYSPDDLPTVWSLIPGIIRDIVKLTSIGVGTGLAFGYATGWLLRWLRWRGVSAYVEAMCTVSLSYLLFYVTQGPCKGSGVIAVCVYGLYGAATAHWGKLASDEESGVQEAVWDSVAWAANGLVFFWGGIAAVNLVARSTTFLNQTGWSYAAIPLNYVFMFAFRFLCILLFNPLFKLAGTSFTLPQVTFATVSGLRGSLSLILTADFIIKNNFLNGSPTLEENADIVLWVAAFVLLTLLVNAPCIGPIMLATGLSKVTEDQVHGRKRALTELQEFSARAMEDLKYEKDEFLQGANWAVVAEFVDHSQALEGFVPSSERRGFSLRLPRMCGAWLARRRRASASKSSEAVQLGADSPELAGTPRASADAGAALDSAGSVQMEVPFLPRPSSVLEAPAGGAGGKLGRVSSRIGLRRHGSGRSLVRASSSQAPHGNGADLARVTVDAGEAAASPAHATRALLPAVLGQHAMQGGGLSAAAAAAAPRNVDFRARRGGGMARGRQFQSSPDVFSSHRGAPSDGMTPVVGAPGLGSKPASTLGDETEEAVEVLWSSNDAGADAFASKYDAGMPSAPVPASAPAPVTSHPRGPSGQALAQAMRRQLTSAAAGTAGVAGGASDLDLLGKRPSRMYASSDPAPSAAGLPAAQPVTAALMEQATNKRELALRALSVHKKIRNGRDDDSGSSPQGNSTSDSSSREESGLSVGALRHRILIGMQRYAAHKRMAGLLSTTGLQVLKYACERSLGTLEEAHGDVPLDLWQNIEREVSGGWYTWLLSRLLASTLRTHAASAPWWRAATRWPFAAFARLLRRQLAGRMLTACEVAVEMCMGLTWGAQMSWVYDREDTPASLLDEVNGQLQGAYDFIAEREAEASYQFQAIQSYRAAMAVLRQQRNCVKGLYEQAVVDETERDTLMAVVDRKIRKLDLTGPTWRPPTPVQVARGLPFLRNAPSGLADAILAHASPRECKEGEVVLRVEGRQQPGMGAAAPAPAPRSSGFYAVVAGVVDAKHTAPGSTDPRMQLKGVGACVGILAALTGTPLPGTQQVVALGNSFGRGPLLFHFPQACLDSLDKRCEAGEAEAEAVNLALHRLAGLEVLEHIEADLTLAVRSYLTRHRPLGKYAPGHDQEDRTLRYTSQVLMDLLRDMAEASLVCLSPGAAQPQAGHLVLLAGSLTPTSAAARGIAGSERLHAPGVIPWLASHRFSFADTAGAGGSAAAWAAGPEGATLLQCSQ